MSNELGSLTSTATVAVAGAAAAYGVVLSLSFNCLYLLWSSRATAMGWRLIIYVSWTLLLATCTAAFQIRYTQDVLSPQSPSELTRNGLVETALTFVQHWSTDGQILYRCYVIYRFKTQILAIFGLLYAACVGIGCTVVAVDTIKSTELRYLMLAYLCVASVLQVCLQLAVIGRVLYIRRLSRRVNTDKAVTSRYDDNYTSLASIHIESASLDTAILIMYLIGFLLNDSLATVSSSLMGPVLAIASLLIITRVAHGCGWSPNTSPCPTTETGQGQGAMVFADRNAEDSTVADSIA